MSLESDVGVRKVSFESHGELRPKLSRKSKSDIRDLSDEERQGASNNRRRPSWRPSLSLIRQESSSFNVFTSQEQRRYPQNERRRISDAHEEQNARRKGKPASHGKKRRKKSARHGQQQQQQPDLEGGQQHQSSRKVQLGVMPSLAQVLDKKTRYPLSYEDFEAFLRHHRAVEYLNFWTDVTAHEQLCRTFEISERRLRREQQSGERALDRDRRRLAALTGDSQGHRLSHDTADRYPYLDRKTSNGFPESSRNTSPQHQQLQKQGSNDSNLYYTSRSSLQLPVQDHLSIRPEIRHNAPSPIPLSTPQRRRSEQRGMAGTYNRILTSSPGYYRSSVEESRQSVEGTVVPDVDDSAIHAQSTYVNTKERASTNPPPIGPKSKARQSSAKTNASRNGLSAQQSSSQQQRQHSSPTLTTFQGSPSLQVQDEMAQLVEAVEDMLHHPTHLGIHEDHSNTTEHRRLAHETSQEPLTLHRKPSAIPREDSNTNSLQLPLTVYRSGEGSSSDIPSPYSTIQNGRTSASAEAALLVQSFRAIGLEDLEESVLRIYRKYLVMLRTTSMTREEETAATTTTTTTTSNMTVIEPRNAVPGRISGEGSFAPGWDGYAGQVIAEWNTKWAGRRADGRRRSRRHSARRDTLMSAKRSSGISSKQPMTEKGSPDIVPGHTEDVAGSKDEDDDGNETVIQDHLRR
ncbi:hypothetical protein BGZ65_007565 [Modicella reniformis]|uniref:RGS domain-containing protein n=1 Tax=Modicella reniformis TaxID=1440133 RepID=A0A9P6M870_9FUNG|nr:hypothetical protein BGZ65_007565 [Modicella reniformis]